MDRFKFRTPWYLGDKFAGFQYWEFEHGRVKLVGLYWEPWVSRRDELTAKPDEQCTGLKDRNGDLIYDGDVVYDKIYENAFIISWDDDRTGYILSAHNTNHIDYLSKLLINRHQLEIIGNIHERDE